MQMPGGIPVLLLVAGFAAFSALAASQSQSALESDSSSNSASSVAPVVSVEPSVVFSTTISTSIYVPPTEKEKAHAYFTSSFGIYSIIGNGFAAGINQAYDSPPEWGQGTEAYAKRFGSNLGIGAINTTTRYGLAEAFKEDNFYYNCECKGFGRRLRHAAFSTLTARRGCDGHVVFSVPSLVAPYVGSAVGVYAWYPDRFGTKDWFRMGNYLLLQSAGLNIGMEFLARGPNSLLGRMHMSGRAPTGTSR